MKTSIPFVKVNGVSNDLTLDELFSRVQPDADTPATYRWFYLGMIFGHAAKLEKENALLRAKLGLQSEVKT